MTPPPVPHSPALNREISLDTETTGLDPTRGHRLVEIGGVEMIGGLRTGKTFHVYLNPERDVPEDAQRIHGLSNQFLADKPTFAAQASAFLDFIGDSRLVIHNAEFDLKFLNYQLSALKLPTIPLARATDTVLMARKKFPGSPANLDALCKRFNIDTTARTFHGALLDAELLADVYLELMGGAQVSLLVDEKASAASRYVPHTPRAVPKRSFLPSEQEVAAHHAFVHAKLKNALWTQVWEHEKVDAGA